MGVKSPPRNLNEFVKDDKRANCAVCQLPSDVRAQLADARSREIKQTTVLAWLKTEYGVTLTSSDFRRHGVAQHDAP